MGTTRASSIKRKEPEPDVVAKGKPTANGTHTANGSPTEAGTPVANGKTTGTARATRSSTASKASPRGDAKEEVKPVPFQVAGAGSAKRKAPEPDVVANGKPSAKGTHVPNGKPAANGSPLANGTPVANGNTPGSARVTRSSTGCKVPVKGDAKDEGAAVKPVPFALENGVSKVNGVSNRETPAKKSPAVAMVSPKLKRGESTPQVVANGAAKSNGTASKSGTKGRKVADTPQSKKARQTEQNGTPASVRRATPDHSGSSDSYHEDEQDEENEVEVEVVEKKPASRKNLLTKKKNKDGELVCQFLGDPIPDAEAKKRWPERYKKKSSKSNVVKSADEDEDIFARQHYTKADVEGVVYNLGDDVYVKAEDGSPNFIGRIVEFFVSIDMKLFFTAQWFFRAEDTVIGMCSAGHDPHRVFLSEEKNENLLDCIVSKINIVQIELKRQQSIPPCDLYYDMSYSLSYTSFAKLHSDKRKSKSESSDATASLLDLYSGCGAMSTGLCLGAHLNKLKLVTRWAVDLSPYACASLKYNHSETHVRNENAENFLELLKEWEKLSLKSHPCFNNTIDDDSGEVNEDDPTSEGDSGDCEEIFEVEKLVDIRYGDPDDSDIKELMFKVRWKGYGPEEDKWEPLKNLNCPERIELFVEEGLKAKILPLPGDVDVICGGPPCQGISGFNRFRNRESPLDDTKNQQIVVYMDIVQHLKPKFVLMENVVDLLKFAEGFLGRYAISRLVKLNYQTRLGIMAAGCYGLPQFRLRAFLWGALPSENLPKFPLPTHNVVLRGGIPNAFERNLVAFDEDQPRNLKKELFLKDAISDLPPVENDESRDEISYRRAPKTDFQYYIRAKPDEMHKFPFNAKELELVDTLYDHRPLRLNTDDFQRVQYIPKKKGANFRDMPGLRVRPDNVIELDSNVERRLLPSGKPLVPDYAISFMKGRSLKPFGRLWWDGTVPTVVTRAEPHNQIILHPEQDRVLTIRENARLQGLPDYYKLTGPVKERYIQVGNAVAVPVARALGYALAQAFRGLGDPNDPLLVLPENFP